MDEWKDSIISCILMLPGAVGNIDDIARNCPRPENVPKQQKFLKLLREDPLKRFQIIQNSICLQSNAVNNATSTSPDQNPKNTWKSKKSKSRRPTYSLSLADYDNYFLKQSVVWMKMGPSRRGIDFADFCLSSASQIRSECRDVLWRMVGIIDSVLDMPLAKQGSINNHQQLTNHRAIKFSSDDDEVIPYSNSDLNIPAPNLSALDEAVNADSSTKQVIEIEVNAGNIAQDLIAAALPLQFASTPKSRSFQHLSKKKRRGGNHIWFDEMISEAAVQYDQNLFSSQDNYYDKVQSYDDAAGKNRSAGEPMEYLYSWVPDNCRHNFTEVVSFADRIKLWARLWEQSVLLDPTAQMVRSLDYIENNVFFWAVNSTSTSQQLLTSSSSLSSEKAPYNCHNDREDFLLQLLNTDCMTGGENIIISALMPVVVVGVAPSQCGQDSIVVRRLNSTCSWTTTRCTEQLLDVSYVLRLLSSQPASAMDTKNKKWCIDGCSSEQSFQEINRSNFISKYITGGNISYNESQKYFLVSKELTKPRQNKTVVDVTDSAANSDDSSSHYLQQENKAEETNGMIPNVEEKSSAQVRSHRKSNMEISECPPTIEEQGLSSDDVWQQLFTLLQLDLTDVSCTAARATCYQAPLGVNKNYWDQRYRLLHRFDEGIVLDSESWYSITPEAISRYIAQICLHASVHRNAAFATVITTSTTTVEQAPVRLTSDISNGEEHILCDTGTSNESNQSCARSANHSKHIEDKTAPNSSVESQSQLLGCCESDYSNKEAVIVLDCFCGCGGNTIPFLLDDRCSFTLSIDIDPDKLRGLMHNAELYGCPRHQVNVICADVISFLESHIEPSRLEAIERKLKANLRKLRNCIFSNSLECRSNKKKAGKPSDEQPQKKKPKHSTSSSISSDRELHPINDNLIKGSVLQQSLPVDVDSTTMKENINKWSEESTRINGDDCKSDSLFSNNNSKTTENKTGVGGDGEIQNMRENDGVSSDDDDDDEEEEQKDEEDQYDEIPSVDRIKNITDNCENVTSESNVDRENENAYEALEESSNDNATQCGRSISYLADIVVMSPPWGGPQYTHAAQFDLNTMLPCGSGIRLAMLAAEVAVNIVYVLPKNTSVAQLLILSRILQRPYLIDHMLLSHAPKMMVVYFGPIALHTWPKTAK